MVTLQAALMAMLLSNPGQIELLDFYADWCEPCRAMQPAIQALEAKGYPVKKVNIDQNRGLAVQYGIQSVPCYVLLADGKEVDRVSGGTSFSRLEKMFQTAAAAGRPMPPNNNPPSGNFAAPGNPPDPQAQNARLIAASVRLRVEDPAGRSCGSGTIIDARGGKALILTCGHLFRESQGKGKIEVDLFGPYAGQKVEGRLESFDAEGRDIGLVSIRIPGPIAAARLAPAGYVVRQRDVVASVGCDNGADPTVRRSQITSIDRYQGPSNLQVAGQPVEGRSGGGLFSAEGFVIGVCNARDPKDQEGLFAALEPIRAQLDQVGLAFVHQSPQGWENPAAASSPGLLAAAASNPAIVPVSFAEPSTGMNAGERAALEEIQRHLRDGAEVVCVIRPRNAPDAKSEVLMLDRVSPEFVKQLSAASQPKDGLRHTSLEVARPRKKLLEWSLTGTVLDK